MGKKWFLRIAVLTIIVGAFFVWFMSSAKAWETIRAKKGDKFSIGLASNPTTGYHWELEFNSNYIQLIDREYRLHKTGLIGGGGEEIFEFLALEAGKTGITFSYLRSPKTENPLIKVFDIIIE
jgi:predicted secreted protein